MTYLASDSTQRSVITKEFDALTPEELKTHAAEVAHAKLDELKELHNLGTYGRMKRSQAKNIVDTRWVIRWKLVGGKRIVKVRITM